MPPPVPRSLPVADDDSGTNVQERGVDEPDLVKAADGRIFVVAGGKLHAVAAGGLELLGSRSSSTAGATSCCYAAGASS